MQLEYEEKEDAYRRQKDVDMHTPANIECMPHREPVLRITNMSDGTFVATSQVCTCSSPLDLGHIRLRASHTSL